VKKLPTSESEFYQLLRDETLASIFWERLELKTDSGYPDTNAMLRDTKAEHTIELKFQKTDPKKLPNLSVLMEPSQKANFHEYKAAGGLRRWLLCCNKQGRVHLYTTEIVCQILLGKRVGEEPMASADFFGKPLPVRLWLPIMLGMID
jgi:hypothetical protein